MGFGGGGGGGAKAAKTEPHGDVKVDPNAGVYKPVTQNRFEGDTYARPLLAPAKTKSMTG